jgi:hypothetical protein
MLVQIDIVTQDITDLVADFLLLKNASDGLVGPELKANQFSGGMLALYNRPDLTSMGSVKLLPDVNGITAKNIILVGIGPGRQLRYETLNLMCHKAIEAISENKPFMNNSVIATFSHGVGWGLDDKEVFTTQLFGLKQALEKSRKSELVKKIIFCEITKDNTNRQRTYLEELVSLADTPIVKQDNLYFMRLGIRYSVTNEHSSKLASSEYVFVAMPFAPEFENVYDFGLRLPIEQNGLLPVRTDKEIFFGSIMEEIKKRISDSTFIIADVSTLNPNVMFELGFAHGCQKSTIIICRTDQKLPFDVAGINILFYNPLLIRDLNLSLSNAIKHLITPKHSI